MKINAVMEHHRRLETCVESLRDWCSSWRLQLNPDKTELIWFCSRVNLVTLRQLNVMSLNLCSVAVEPVDSVWDLGVILDNELSMRVHISKISSTCFFHVHCLRTLRPLIDTASAQLLASAFILSRVDYCNAVLAGLPTSTLAPLQRVLNAAASFVAGTTCQLYYEVITLASDCPSDLLQTLCRYFISNGHNNTDLIIAWPSLASFSNDGWIPHSSHQDKIWRPSFLWCWTTRVECTSCRYK